jgi:hypothetical protein
MRPRTPIPVHVVVTRTPGRDHQADRRCWCDPIPSRDLAEPARPVFVHRVMAGSPAGYVPLTGRADA